VVEVCEKLAQVRGGERSSGAFRGLWVVGPKGHCRGRVDLDQVGAGQWGGCREAAVPTEPAGDGLGRAKSLGAFAAGRDPGDRGLGGKEVDGVAVVVDESGAGGVELTLLGRGAEGFVEGGDHGEHSS
jgi:hypothetical protein